MTQFVEKLTHAIERHQRGQKDAEEEWDEHDYERFMKECDARTDKYGELLEEVPGDSDEAEAKISKEMGWDRELNDDEAEKRDRWIDEMNRALRRSLERTGTAAGSTPRGDRLDPHRRWRPSPPASTSLLRKRDEVLAPGQSPRHGTTC